MPSQVATAAVAPAAPAPAPAATPESAAAAAPPGANPAEPVDVVIVGGGPNGLMLACELALGAVRPLVLERLPERSTEPKANGMVGQVVRLFDHRGLYQRFTGASGAPRPVPRYMFSAFPLDLSAVEDNPLHILPLPQRRLEALLEERAVELGVRIRRGHALTGLTQDADAVTATVEGPDGAYQLRARYLVGCDGGHSVVRKQAGIGFPGSAAADTVSRTAHVSLPGLNPGRDGSLDIPGFGRVSANLYHRTERGVFIFGLIEPGRPLVSTLEWGPAAADDEPMTLAEVEQSVRRVLGADLRLAPPAGPGPHLMRRLAGRDTRVAERYRGGRVLLVGDAAHVHAAVGGPGLNLGLQDAANLGWRLAAQLRGTAPADLLDGYHAERHPVAERVSMHTLAQTGLMAPETQITALRTIVGELLEVPDNRRRIAALLAGSDVRYPAVGAHPLAGYFAPELTVAAAGKGFGAKGGRRLAELMHAARPVLLDLSGSRAEFAQAAEGWTDRVDVVAAEPGRSTRRADDRTAAEALLIRPDGYVAWASAPGDHGRQARKELKQALETWFGAPGTQ